MTFKYCKKSGCALEFDHAGQHLKAGPEEYIPIEQYPLHHHKVKCIECGQVINIELWVEMPLG